MLGKSSGLRKLKILIFGKSKRFQELNCDLWTYTIKWQNLSIRGDFHSLRFCYVFALVLVWFHMWLPPGLESLHHDISRKFRALSSFSGSISWVTATPTDVVKSRMQADAQLQRKYKGVLHCIIHSYKTEGVQVSNDFNQPKLYEHCF